MSRDSSIYDPLMINILLVELVFSLVGEDSVYIIVKSIREILLDDLLFVVSRLPLNT